MTTGPQETVHEEPLDPVEAKWHHVLVHGHRSKLRMMPGGPRCRMCHAPMGGIGGFFSKPFGLHKSRMNPNFCNI